MNVDKGYKRQNGNSRQIDETAVIGGHSQGLRQCNTQIHKDIVKIAGPANGHSRHGEGVLQNQIPADDPSPEFPQGYIAIRVGTAGNGHHSSEFGITESRTATGDSSNNERNNQCRTGIIRSCHPCQNEDPCPYDGPNPQHCQAKGSENAVHTAVLLGF